MRRGLAALADRPYHQRLAAHAVDKFLMGSTLLPR
jgi:hypothetical protein